MNKVSLIGVILVLISISGCSYFKKEPEIIPENFIIKQNTKFIFSEIENLQPDNEHLVKYKRGEAEFTQSEQDKLINWLDDIQPIMITIRGTGGAEKYFELGNQRARSVIDFMQLTHLNVEILLLDYDSSLPGGRAVIQEVPRELASVIQQQAPILIIKSN